MTETPPPPAPKRENLIVNLLCNLVVPTLILTKFSTERWLGPVWGLIIALAFPVGYGIWDFSQRRHANLVSMIGFASVLLSGSLGLLKVGGIWFAIKDAAMPTVIGIAVIVSMRTKQPLVRALLLNDQILDVARVEAELEKRQNRPAFDRMLGRASYGLAFSFLISAVLNFFLARYLLVSPPGTPEFNHELGKMHAWSLPVIMVPSMIMMVAILWRLLNGIEALTGLDSDAIFHSEKPKKSDH